MSGHRPDPDAVARLLRTRLTQGVLELSVSGPSMGRTIGPGSVVTVEPARQPRSGEVWVYVDDDSAVVVHRLRHIGPAVVTGRGVGNSSDDAPVGRHRLVGRVVASYGPEGSKRTFGRLDRFRAATVLRFRGRLRRMLDRRPG